MVKANCYECLTRALRAAYEAGRADALVGPICHCGKTLTVECNCCHAPAGEPCRHEVTLARREGERCVKCGAKETP